MTQKKLSLQEIALEFELIDPETHLFFNTETGEFDFYDEFTGDEDSARFERKCWIPCPSHRDIEEYGMMTDFLNTVAGPQKQALLSVAIDGKGAFRRFKDTLRRVGLTDEWYAFRQAAFVSRAKEWCDDNGLVYHTQTSPEGITPR